MIDGVIVKGVGGRYCVRAEGTVYDCGARGKFRNQSLTPMVGDMVEISVDGTDCSIENIRPRKTMLVRPAVANIEQLVIVAALSAPQPNLELVDNFLLIGEVIGINILLCLNKTDLTEAGEIKEIYEKAGYRVVCTSAALSEGIEELREAIRGKITAFAGNSGVGKSSILNALGLTVKMETGEISKKIQRGKHTTRHVELLSLPSGGLVLDTPGFSTFELPNVRAQDLERYFPEFAPYLGKCRFRGCSHTSEPDCTVLSALSDGAISQHRHGSYVKMYNELKKIKEWER
jgi:ribosome biogenesis GTPase